MSAVAARSALAAANFFIISARRSSADCFGAGAEVEVEIGSESDAILRKTTPNIGVDQGQSAKCAFVARHSTLETLTLTILKGGVAGCGPEWLGQA